MREVIVYEDDCDYDKDQYEVIVRCRDCKHRMHDKTCIKNMKRKPDDGYCDEGELKQY